MGFQQKCLGQFLSQPNQFCPALSEIQIGKKQKSTASREFTKGKKTTSRNGRLLPCTQTQLYLQSGERGTRAAAVHLFVSGFVTCNSPISTSRASYSMSTSSRDSCTMEKGDKLTQ